ncbi:hypothetical protein PUR25_01965 [Streptomyces sp. JV181]|uniref:hypothetical protein n=1 Tax=Streptomyces sp. JV181 TaxID=858635 RepID=UPI002E7AA37C|nr:hypothetical protein [Streptomyces sp. JV181]MEE1774855.1 hypothetical protein [Streptomyces sp. JV181]
MSTPEELPDPQDALAHASRAKMAAALDEDQEPEPDEPAGWQPVWKRPRTPRSKTAKKLQLHKQRRRLQDAGKRRLAAGESRRPALHPVTVRDPADQGGRQLPGQRPRP